eukprot:scaffold99763_cov48-Phaeocystis_antarctica.AAC.1
MLDTPHDGKFVFGAHLDASNGARRARGSWPGCGGWPRRPTRSWSACRPCATRGACRRAAHARVRRGHVRRHLGGGAGERRRGSCASPSPSLNPSLSPNLDPSPNPDPDPDPNPARDRMPGHGRRRRRPADTYARGHCTVRTNLFRAPRACRATAYRVVHHGRRCLDSSALPGRGSAAEPTATADPTAAFDQPGGDAELRLRVGAPRRPRL